MKYFYVILVIIFVLNFKNSICCIIDNDYANVCSSLNELSATGNHPEWTNLTVKNYGNESLQIFKNDIFKNFPNLLTLNIIGVASGFEEFTFRGLNKLKELYVEDNNLEELPNLNGLSELILVRIYNSSVKTIPNNYIPKVNKIRGVDFSNNLISTIGDCAFCNLKEGYIFLSNNSLTSFDAPRILGSTSLLQGINLDENKLTKVTPFGNMPAFVGASYVNNSIELIEQNAFKNTPNISLIDVSFNRVQNIPVDIFPENFNEKDPFFLIIHNNNIKCLSKDIRNKFKILRRITVSENPWNCECLEEVRVWAAKLNAFIGCDLERTCVVSCTDNNNIKKNIKFY